MKALWIYILFLLLLMNGTVLVRAQTKEDKKLKSYSVSQSRKSADSLFDLGVKNQDNGNFPQALVFFEKSLGLYQNLGEFKNTGDCYSYIGTTYYYQGDYSKALIFFNKSIQAYKKAGHKKGISSILNNMGGVYYFLGNYPRALDLYKQAVIIQEEIGDKRITAATTQNIGGIYSKVKDYPNAMKYYNKSYSIYKKLNDIKAIAQNLNVIGFVFIKEKDYNKAFSSLTQALAISDKVNDKQIKVEVLSNLGELFYDQSDYNKSLYYYNICLKYSDEINSLQYKSDSQIAIGNIFHKLGKNQEAINKCQSGLKIAEKLGSVPAKKDACECLYKTYKSLGQDKKALYFYEKVNFFEVNLQSEETSNRMMNMEFQKQQLVDSLANVKKEHIIKLKHTEEIQNREKQRNIIIITLCFILVIALGLWSRLNFVRKSRAAIKVEKDNSERLLLNILPEEIAEELKANGYVNAKNFNLVSILFTDFKSFTETSEKLSPRDLVEEINVCFKAFDMICGKYNIEKIKTIGDAYMAAGGIPKPDIHSLRNIVSAGIEMQKFMSERKRAHDDQSKPTFEMRLGIHAGPIVAGIVGVKKFQYDVWGDTVNTASRMESSGEVGKVNISEALYNLIKNEPDFSFEYRGMIQAKGKGEVKMYFVFNNTTGIPENSVE